MKVIWIEEEILKMGSYRADGIIKSIFFRERKTFDKIPKNEEFTLVLAKYDSLSPVIVGHLRFKNCLVINSNESTLNIDIKVKEDGFFQLSQHAELRSDKISSLNL